MGRQYIPDLALPRGRHQRDPLVTAPAFRACQRARRRMRITIFRSVLALVVMSVASVALAPAAQAAVATDCTRFVSTTGSDTAAGTQAAPWRTVLSALNKVTAGTVLCVMPGTYTQEVVDSSLPAGTATGKITVKSYDSANRALLDGRVSLSGLRYWTISDLRFTNPTPTATDITSARIVALIGGNDVAFQNNEVFDGQYAGLLVGRSSATSSTWPMRFTIRGNYIHDTKAANVYFNPGAGSAGHLIERNRLVNAGTENLKIGWGDDCTGYSGGTAGYGAGGTTARYNTLVNGGSGGNLIFAEPGGQHDVLAYRNLLVDRDSERGFHVRYDSATASTAHPSGCLGDRVTVTDNWARGWKAGSTAQIPFSEDFNDAPQSQARERDNVVGPDPLLDANYVPQNAAARAYGYAAA